MRIHLCDIVTVEDSRTPKKFMHVVGVRDIGKYEELEGMWEVQEWNSDNQEKYVTFGIFMTVWKPIRPPAKSKEGQALRTTGQVPPLGQGVGCNTKVCPSPDGPCPCESKS